MTQNAPQIPARILTAIIAGAAGVGFASAAMATGFGDRASGNQVAEPGIFLPDGAAEAHLNAYILASANAQLKRAQTAGENGAAERPGTNGDEQSQASAARLAAVAKAKRSATR